MKIMSIIAIVLLGLTLGGCAGKQTVGKSLGGSWVVHNSTTQTMTALGETEVVSLSTLKEFNSYQSPVLDGLNNATDDYLDGDEDTTTTSMILEFITPMLERMLQLTEEADDE